MPLRLITFTSYQASSHRKPPTHSLACVAVYHQTALLIGSLQQQSNANYAYPSSLLIPYPNARVTPSLTPLATTSLNASASAKLVPTISFVMDLLVPSPPFLPPQASSYPAPLLTSNQNFASHPIPMPAPSTFPLTPTPPFHLTCTMAARTPPSALILRLAAHRLSLLLIILPRMLYTLSRPMPIHISSRMNVGNWAESINVIPQPQL